MYMRIISTETIYVKQKKRYEKAAYSAAFSS